MTALDWLARLPQVERIGWTLVHTLWQGLVVALVLGFSLRRMRNANSRIRYGLACGAMLVFTLCTPITFMLLGRADADTGALTASPIAFARTVILPRAELPRAPMAGLVAFWICGSLLCSGRMLGGWSRLGRMRRMGTRAGAQLACRLDILSLRFGLRCEVALRISEKLTSPSTFGWIRPVILLPAGALSGLSAAQVDAILAHELAHIRRADYLINLWQMAVEAVYYYHPAVWWISGVIRSEREFCCDDLVVRITGNAAAYATALATLEEMRPMALLPGMAASGGPLLTRVKRILGRPAEPSVSPRGASALPALAMTGLVTMVAVGLWAGVPAFGRTPQNEAKPAAPARPAQPGREVAPEAAERIAAVVAKLQGREQTEAEQAALKQQRRALQTEKQALQQAEKAQLQAELAAQKAVKARRERGATRSRAETKARRSREAVEPESPGETAQQAAREKEVAAASRLDPAEVTVERPGQEPLTIEQETTSRRPATARAALRFLQAAQEKMTADRARSEQVRSELLLRLRSTDGQAAQELLHSRQTELRAAQELRARRTDDRPIQELREAQADRGELNAAVARERLQASRAAQDAVRRGGRILRNSEAVDEARRAAEQDAVAKEHAFRAERITAEAQNRTARIQAEIAGRAARRQAEQSDMAGRIQAEVAGRAARRNIDVTGRIARIQSEQDARQATPRDRQAMEAKLLRLEERTRQLERQLEAMERRLEAEQNRKPEQPGRVAPARRPERVRTPSTPRKTEQPADPAKKPAEDVTAQVEINVEKPVQALRR